MPSRAVTLASLDERRIPLFVTIPERAYRAGLEVRVDVVMGGAFPETQHVKAPFLGPPR